MKSFLTIVPSTVLIFFHSYSNIHGLSSGSLRPGALGKTGPAKIFPFKPYEEFQTSDGIAGKSLEKARKVFVEPFDGVDLSEITQNDLNNLVTMTQAARDMEINFDKAIKEAGATKRHPNVPLSAGKTANKILKIVAEIQTIEIHQKLNLQPNDAENRLKEQQTKLKKNVGLDHHYAGKKMLSYLSVGQNRGEHSQKNNGGH